MPVRTELHVRLPNSPGALEGACRVLGDERVDIAALMLEPGGQLRLIVDNHVRAAGALRERRYAVTEREVVTAHLPDAPGALARFLELFRHAGINVDYAYAAVASGSSLVVVGVADAMRAASAAGV